MMNLLKEIGYEKASLAVQKANYAVKMYRNVGFRTVDENEEEYIMVCDLSVGKVFVLYVDGEPVGTVTISDNNINRLSVMPE